MGSSRESVSYEMLVKMKERVSKFWGFVGICSLKFSSRGGRGKARHNKLVQESMLPKLFSCRWEVGVNFNAAIVHE